MQVTRLDFAPEHAHSYNELIEVVKLNLLLADWNDEDHNESLLSVRNTKWGKEMLRNVRYPKLCFTASGPNTKNDKRQWKCCEMSGNQNCVSRHLGHTQNQEWQRIAARYGSSATYGGLKLVFGLKR